MYEKYTLHAIIAKYDRLMFFCSTVRASEGPALPQLSLNKVLIQSLYQFALQLHCPGFKVLTCVVVEFGTTFDSSCLCCGR